VNLFRLRLWPFGPNLLAGGLYRLNGWWALILWPLDRNTITVQLPVRALKPWKLR
jgi:hypothetical protein